MKCNSLQNLSCCLVCISYLRMSYTVVCLQDIITDALGILFTHSLCGIEDVHTLFIIICVIVFWVTSVNKKQQ